MARWSEEKDQMVFKVYGSRNEIPFEELKELADKVSMTPGTVKRRIKVLRERNRIPSHVREELMNVVRDLRKILDKDKYLEDMERDPVMNFIDKGALRKKS